MNTNKKTKNTLSKATKSTIGTLGIALTIITTIITTAYICSTGSNILYIAPLIFIAAIILAFASQWAFEDNYGKNLKKNINALNKVREENKSDLTLEGMYKEMRLSQAVNGAV